MQYPYQSMGLLLSPMYPLRNADVHENDGEGAALLFISLGMT